MTPTFSIVVPVYNVQDFLEEAIESLLVQTYKNFEIILVNDGSTDSSGEICRKYKEENNQIILIEQENKGLSEARNVGMKKASGKYIYFFDSDDILSKNSLYDWYNIFKDKSVDIIVFEGQPFGLKNANFKYKRSSIHYDKVLSSKKVIYDSKLDLTYTPSACLYVIKKEMLSSHCFYPRITHEDELFYVQLMIGRELKTYVSPVAYFKRRLRENSIMTMKKSDSNFYGYEKVLTEILVDDEILKNKKIVKLVSNDLIRLMVTVAVQVDGRIISFSKRVSLINIFRLLVKNKLFSKTCILCLLPELKRFRST